MLRAREEELFFLSYFTIVFKFKILTILGEQLMHVQLHHVPCELSKQQKNKIITGITEIL